VLEVGIVPQVPTASASPHAWTLKWVYEELGGATKLECNEIMAPKFVVSYEILGLSESF